MSSYAKLANGFRLQAASGQTCTVYFSGNAVETGFPPNALATVLGCTEAEADIRDPVKSHRARASDFRGT